VVPGNTGQGTRCHCQGIKDLRSIKKIVEGWNQREGEPGGKGKQDEGQMCGDSPGQGQMADGEWRVTDRMLTILRGTEVWRAALFSNPRAGATVEALSIREEKQVNPITEKNELLR